MAAQPGQPRSYAGHWEKPEWVYDQILQVERRIEEPDMVALKKRSAALFQQKMAQEFAEFFQHYTKVFFRVINKQLNKQLAMMLLMQRQKMDNGEVSWQEGNNEVIGASFNLMLRKLDPETQQKIINTYSDLVKEEREETEAAIKAKLAEMGHAASTESIGPDGPDAVNAVDNIDKIIDDIYRAPQRINVVPEDDIDAIKVDQKEK